MKRKPMIALILFSLFGIAAGIGWSMTSRGAYESAEYQVVDSDDGFELRRYPDLILVTTGSDPTFQGSDGSFMRLFRYISGENEDQQKVSMTTPVFMDSADRGPNSRMGFVIPKEVAQRGAPLPTADSVQLRTRAGGLYAVLRFAGRLNETSAESSAERLRQHLSEKGLNAVSEMEFAGYDPPWTPGPLRRNEAMVRVEQ